MGIVSVNGEREVRRRFLAGLAVLFLVLMMVSLAQAWSRLPDDLPLHFSFNGTPDGGGSKGELLSVVGIVILATLPLLAGVLDNLDTLPGWALWPGMGALVLVLLIYIPGMIRMPRKLLFRNGTSGRSRP